MKQKLLLLLCLLAMPFVNALGDEYTDEQGVKYTLNEDGNTYSVSGHTDACTGDITIPETVNGRSVTTIRLEAFRGIGGMGSVTIPKSVISIEGNPFSPSILGFGPIGSKPRIIVAEENPVYDSRDNCNALIETATDKLIYGYSSIPNSVRVIGDCAFQQDFSLSRNTIPNGVTSIGDRAFCYCPNLESIIIPGSVTSIGPRAFADCERLSTVVCYAENVPTTSTDVFEYTNIGNATLYVPEGSIAAYQAAEPWDGFGRFVAIPAGTPVQNYTDAQGVKYTLNEGRITYTVSGHTDACAGAIVIPETVNGWSVTDIASEAFQYCSELTSIFIPKSVTNIACGDFFPYPYTPFNGCDKLASISVEEGNPIFDSRDNCNAIIRKANQQLVLGCKSTTIPNSVTSINAFAFRGCYGLTSIFIPKNVTSIGLSVFADCSALASIIVEEGNPVYDSRSNCNAIIETASNTLIEGCNTTIIPNDIKAIYHSAFNGRGGLTSVIIPAGVTSIGTWAFCGTGLTSLTIPASVTSIEDDAFSYCYHLTDVYCYEENVPNIDANVFESTNIGNVTLHVPVGSVDAYKAATPWKGFKEIAGLTGSVKLNKTKANIEKGKTLTLKATVSPSTLLDKSVTWKSSSTKIVKVSSSGKVTGVGAGTATITCTHVVTGAKATCKVTIGYVTLDKTTVSVKKGKTVTLTPTVYPSTLTDKSVTWKSSDTNIATVSSDGKVKGVKYGQATITCTSVATGLSTTCLVTVGSIILDESVLTLEKGKTFTLEPAVYPSTLEDKSVTWTSSDTGIATVSSSGKVKGVKAGTATITCTSVTTGLSATCEVTVSYVKLDKTTASINPGKTLTLKATVYPSTLEDRSVTWKSSNTKIATVSTSGKVKGVKAGTATITCTSNATGLSASCKVTVGSVSLDKTTLTLQKGKTSTLTATVAPSTLEDQSVTWKSSDTGIATVSSSGKVKGVKYGTATITCTSNATGLSTSCEVTVVYVKLSKTTVGLEKDKTLTLKTTVYPSTLEDRSVTWKSSDTKIATVSSSGKVTGVGYGTATITCTSKATGIKATCKVTVGKVVLSMSDFSIKKSRAITLEATVYPETLADQSVTWESSDTNIATVSSTGRIKGIKAGTVTITCTSNATGLSATCTVTVLSVSESRSFEGDDDDATGIGELENAPAEEQPYDVYDLSGRKVAHQVTTLDGLPNGIYIVNGKKVLKK